VRPFTDRLYRLSLEQCRYSLQALPAHLAEIADIERFERVLIDPGFLQAKIDILGPESLIADYALLPNKKSGLDERAESLALLEGAIRISSDILSKSSLQFFSQMTARLFDQSTDPVVAAFLSELSNQTHRPRLRPLRRSLTAPKGVIYRILRGHVGRITGLAMSSDGRRAVSASEDGHVHIWDLEGNQPPIIREMASVSSLALSGNGDIAAIVVYEALISLITLKVPVAARPVIGGTVGIRSVALSSDGRRLVSGDAEGVLVWELETDDDVPVRRLSSPGVVNAVAISDNGRRVMASYDDGTFYVWDLTRDESPLVLKDFSGVYDPMYLDPRERNFKVALSADGTWAAASCETRFVLLWNLEDCNPGRPLPHDWLGVDGVALSADGKRAISGSADYSLLVWDIDESQSPARVIRGHTARICSLALSSDGKRAISGSLDGAVRVWDLGHEPSLPPLGSHRGVLRGLALSGDGKLALIGSLYGGLHLWRIYDQESPQLLQGNTHAFWSVALSSDGRCAVAGTSEGLLHIWYLEDNRAPQIRRDAGSAGIHAIAVSADGTRAVCGDEIDRLQVWNLDGEERPRLLKGHTDGIFAVALSPDGRLAVSGSRDCTVRLWDLERDVAPTILRGHTNGIEDVALSPDRKYAISASHDRTLRVWDLENPENAPGILVGHADSVLCVALSNDSKHAVSGSRDMTLRIWDVEHGTCVSSFFCEAAVVSCAWCGNRIAAMDEAHEFHLLAWEE
jgi:WD40 repeat protein